MPLANSYEELTHWKRLWCWDGLRAGGKGDDRGWDGWIAPPNRWMWLWVNSAREAWRAAIHGVAKSWTRLSDWSELNTLVCQILISCTIMLFVTNVTNFWSVLLTELGPSYFNTSNLIPDFKHADILLPSLQLYLFQCLEAEERRKSKLYKVMSLSYEEKTVISPSQALMSSGKTLQQLPIKLNIHLSLLDQERQLFGIHTEEKKTIQTHPEIN